MKRLIQTRLLYAVQWLLGVANVQVSDTRMLPNVLQPGNKKGIDDDQFPFIYIEKLFLTTEYPWHG